MQIEKLCRGIACDTFEITAKETLIGEIEHLTYCLHAQLIVVEHCFDFEDDIFVDNSRSRFACILMGSSSDLFGWQIKQLSIVFHFAFFLIVLTECPQELVEDLTVEQW